ncbi:MAG: hypothetical protein IKA36_05315 [Clostridia bacterium]|nr:hypothetical protein [Clostridia bacterium]
MKLLRKLTKKELHTKSQEELFDLTIEELKYADKESLIEILSKARDKFIKDQKEYIKEDMEELVAKQLGLIRLIKSKKATESEKDEALDHVIMFFESHDVVLSKELLFETYGLFDYIIKKGDARSARELEVLMTARTKMVKALELDMFSKVILRHSKMVEEMIKIDAEYGLDFACRDHVKGAIAGKFGPLMKKDESIEGFKQRLMSIYKDHAKTEASV